MQFKARNQMTKRLYYEDSFRREFTATVLRSIPGQQGAIGVVLDQTCFYPTSGGQPCDLGTLGLQPVHDVAEQDGQVVHWMQGQVPGPSVQGRIDWMRRFDHMQQHTGQHMLSQAFLQVLTAQTVSFHLGAESSTIDLDCANLETSALQSVEDLVNQVVFEDRPISTRFVPRQDLPLLELRKLPTVDKEIRIVEVEGFDLSPCGGTHCTRSGEVGPVAIRKWERRGQEARVDFLCGWRLVRDYRWRRDAVNELALAFSVKDRELEAAVLRLMEEAAEQRRELHHLHEQRLDEEARSLLASASRWNDTRVVSRAFEARDPMQVRKLASLLVENAHTVALLATSGTQARLVFARSADLSVDMAALLKAVSLHFGGGGGGQPHLAQGGGFSGQQAAEALELAYQTLIEM
jgi:alanyl-tRNA synthetase